MILKRIFNKHTNMAFMCIVAAIWGLAISTVLVYAGLKRTNLVAIYLGWNLALIPILFMLKPGTGDRNRIAVLTVNSFAHLSFFVTLYREGISLWILVALIVLNIGNAGNILDLRESMGALRNPNSD